MLPVVRTHRKGVPSLEYGKRGAKGWVDFHIESERVSSIYSEDLEKEVKKHSVTIGPEAMNFPKGFITGEIGYY